MHNRRTHNQPEQLELRRVLRHRTTPEENALWKILKGKRLAGYRWRRQFSVGPYVLDFYCPKVKLAVEVDGLHHLTEEELLRDSRRADYLSKEGIVVLRVPNRLVWEQCGVVVDAILEQLSALAIASNEEL